VVEVDRSGALAVEGQRVVSDFAEKNMDLSGILQRRVLCGPEHVVIDCNTNCLVCWTYSPLLEDKDRPVRDWYKQTLSIDVFRRLMDDLAELGTKRIRFTGGGEPMLHPFFREAVHCVREKGIILALTTNGLCLNDNMVDFLAAEGIDEVAVSLWAATEKIWLDMHPKGKEGDFYNILHFLQRLKKACPDTKINLLNVLCSLNVREISPMCDLAFAIGADGVYLTLMDSIPGTRHLLLQPEARELAIQEIGRIKKRFYYPEGLYLDNIDGLEDRLRGVVCDSEYDMNTVAGMPCWMGWYFCRIMADGRVAPCCRGVDYSMGNLNEKSFREIWSGEAYNTFRRMGLDEDKSHPYFTKMNCYRMCDNLMHNLIIKNRLSTLSAEQKAELLQIFQPDTVQI
jgi:MoaA/NifB/PqqE/SkfB family radical SAM enzyme